MLNFLSNFLLAISEQFFKGFEISTLRAIFEAFIRK